MAVPVKLDTSFLVRRRWEFEKWALVVLFGCCSIGLPGLLDRVIGRHPSVNLGTLAFAIALIVIGATRIHALQKYTPGTVVIDDAGVRLEDHLIAIAEIEGAYFLPAAGKLPPSVRLVGAKNRLLAQLAVANHEHAESVLAELRLGASQRKVRFYGLSPRASAAWYASVGGLLGGLVVSTAAFPTHAPWLIALGLVMMIASSVLFTKAHFEVGADGLLVDMRVGSIFVPWSDVVSVERSATGVMLRRKSGVLELSVSTRAQMLRKISTRADRDAFFTRINDALAAYRRRDEPDATARIARSGRPHAEWLRALFDHREGSFRTAPLLDDQLWSILECSTAETTARAGAAAVLARNAGEPERARLRAAADACTAPRLRVVLERAASGAGNEDVVAALLTIDEDETNQQAR